MNKEDLDGFIFELFTDDIFLIDDNKITKDASSPNSSVQNKKEISHVTLKNIVLIISENDLQSNKEFLAKVLGAVNLDFDTISVIEKTTTEALQQVRNVIFMGTSPFENGIQNRNFSLYEVADFENKIILQTESAAIIQKNTDKKRALWIALQRMFPNAKS